jgi:hypothetical protein
VVAVFDPLEKNGKEQLRLLRIRFGVAANEIEGQLHEIDVENRRNELVEHTATCPDFDSLRKQLAT